MTDIQSVQTTNQSFYRAFEKKDIEAMETIWSHGVGTLCIHPGRTALKGWPDIRESWQQIFTNTQYLEIDVDIITTEVQGAIAYMVVVEKVMQVLRGRRLEARSMATNIFEKMGDRWYLTHHHGGPIAS
ncbi:MAG: nuclear transport factor 2 family protein [Leptolyngbyaceae bacterium]|nr:nuclear transport factor 2 family protein [Leptolyngbyaceae bacterium]